MKNKLIYTIIVLISLIGFIRVVTLVSKDPRAFGYSPLVAKGEKSNFPIAYTFYLHKPKGSNKLEIIR